MQNYTIYYRQGYSEKRTILYDFWECNLLKYNFPGNDLNLFMHFHLVITYLLQNQMNTTIVLFRMFQTETSVSI